MAPPHRTPARQKLAALAVDATLGAAAPNVDARLRKPRQSAGASHSADRD
jgi:hypothetical protein